ncbi:SpoIIE family protein phosphatase [Niveibacterium terrae]|uniref:SpoIIE family protein phosphatase n=1 Tax=Niveibacterium terrae TaxID=3373598 RepID=UPI003A8F4555
MTIIDAHMVTRPYPWPDSGGGDTGLIRQEEGMCFLGLIDTLGHGQEAFAAAERAKNFLEINFREDLVPLMQRLHKYLESDRGAVAAFCRIDIATGEMLTVGIGNITVKTFGTNPETFVFKDGILGYIAPTPTERETHLFPGDILVIHSDGIRSHFSAIDCSDILPGSAESISTGILKRFSKQNDDASCIILKYLPS